MSSSDVAKGAAVRVQGPEFELFVTRYRKEKDMAAISRAFAALKESKAVPQYIKECEVVVVKMTGNNWFPSPTPALTLVQAHIDDLAKAEKAAHKGPKGAAQDRNVKLGLVRADMRQLKAHVQGVGDANPAEAKAIIESAGMTVAKKPARTKAPFAVKYGKVPGRVQLDAKAAARTATYYWQMSTDGKNWSDLPETLKASTSVDGLTAAMLYHFRFRTLTKAGLVEWSAVASIIAH